MCRFVNAAEQPGLDWFFLFISYSLHFWRIKATDMIVFFSLIFFLSFHLPLTCSSFTLLLLFHCLPPPPLHPHLTRQHSRCSLYRPPRCIVGRFSRCQGWLHPGGFGLSGSSGRLPSRTDECWSSASQPQNEMHGEEEQWNRTKINRERKRRRRSQDLDSRCQNRPSAVFGRPSTCSESEKVSEVMRCRKYK